MIAGLELEGKRKLEEHLELKRNFSVEKSVKPNILSFEKYAHREEKNRQSCRKVI